MRYLSICSLKGFEPRGLTLATCSKRFMARECRSDDTATREILSTINHYETWSTALSERSMLATLGGGCLVPIGARSSVANGILTLRGTVLTEDGRRRISATFRGSWETPLAVGQVLAAMLVDEGANELLNSN